MAEYTSITIIYNPNSTGSGKTLAQELKVKLLKELPEQAIKLVPTKRAGHAEELAYKYAKASERPLIISASGDGGYNEVINGIMLAIQEGARPVAGLLPAGNANDHFSNLHDGDFTHAVLHGKHHLIDLLKLDATNNNSHVKRYAHSYIGLGLTPKAGHELNKVQLNRFNEAWIVAKVLYKLRPTRLKVAGRIRSYDSLVFSNVSKMSKVLSLSQTAELNDGKFEVTAFYRRNKMKLLVSLLKATTTGLHGGLQTDEFTFETLKSSMVQLDGEIITLDAHTAVVVGLERTVLECIV